MAKIVLACWGSYGDLFPSLAIADALTALGHEAVIASCPFYVDLVRAQGHAFRPLRPDVRPDDRTILRRVMDPQRGSEVVVREIAVPQIREAYEDMLAAAHDADLIVSHPITFAAPLAAETLKKPWLATALAFLAWYVYAPQCISTLATIRRETNSWKVMAATAGYLFALAYLAAFATYQIARVLT